MRIVRYHTMGGARVAVVGNPGRIWTKLVWIDSPISCVKVANGDIELFALDIDYKLKRAARLMLKAGKSLGISKGAKKLLKEALKS